MSGNRKNSSGEFLLSCECQRPHKPPKSAGCPLLPTRLHSVYALCVDDGRNTRRARSGCLKQNGGEPARHPAFWQKLTWARAGTWNRANCHKGGTGQLYICISHPAGLMKRPDRDDSSETFWDLKASKTTTLAGFSIGPERKHDDKN